MRGIFSVSARLQGADLSPLLDDPTKQVCETAFSVSYEGRKALLLRDERWAYIQYNEDASAGTVLYDMHKDPKQYVNLANSPEHAEIVAAFKAKMNAKFAAVRTNDLPSMRMPAK